MATTTTGFNLTQATHIARLTVKFGAIALVFLMVGRILLTAFVKFWKATHPPAPPPPTAGYGTLPVIVFPSQSDEDKPGSYTLETASGTTPSFGDRAKVFLMVRTTPSLLADQRAREVAATYNFVFEPKILDASTYRWDKSEPLEMQLEVDIFTQHFRLTSEYVSKPELLDSPSLPDNFEAVARVKDMLSNARLLPPDMATSAGRVKYLKSLGGELGEAVSLSDADYLQVDLDRTPVDDLFLNYGPDGETGVVHAVLVGTYSGADSIVEMSYTYQPIDNTQIETYSIRTSQAAWKILQSGEGYIANKGKNEAATIREVSLGYYESPDEQEYLQPIYVFRGDDGFLGYVPAVDPEYIQAQP